jgi:site-specific recombinase XerD
MKGRLEHSLRTKRTIESLLEGLPECVSDFYYNIQISREPMTCLEYIRKIKSFLEYANCDITEINEKLVDRYFEKISFKVNGEGEVVGETSFSYKKSNWTVLNLFFNYLVKRNIIAVNPIEDTNRPRKKDKIERRFLTMEDLNKILNSVLNGAGSHKAIAKQKDWIERDYLIMFLFMNTGMRKTALSEINLEDISFTEGRLKVVDKRNTEQIYVITEELEHVMNRWLRKREILLSGRECDALFISSLRKRMNEKTIYNLVKKYSEEALGYAISPHKLRAAFVSLYYEATGGDIKATCEAVGHADVSTTSIYITKRNDSREGAQRFMSKGLQVGLLK